MKNPSPSWFFFLSCKCGGEEKERENIHQSPSNVAIFPEMNKQTKRKLIVKKREQERRKKKKIQKFKNIYKGEKDKNN
jgi:hypothetical protein